MPSPFPGMDPYLENVIYWRSVHASLISLLTFALNNSLPDAFVARIEGRSYILPNHDLIYPDAILVRSPSDDAIPPVGTVVTPNKATTLPLLFEYTTEAIDEPFITVLSVDSEEVVTIIEVLSPTNKAPESTGREEYLRKQREILRSPTHLLEIDLLRGGAHSVAIGREAVLSRTQYDYLASLHRAGDERKSRFAVWAWSVRDALPTVAVPLLPGWADVTLDLQAVWNETYRGGRWDRTINYRNATEPPLSPADTIWADTLLREKGLRT